MDDFEGAEGSVGPRRDGLGVGDATGLKDGVSVGAGGRLGPASFGVRLGAFVGVKVGEKVGMVVGTTVGVSVGGFTRGATVGSAVGITVGR